MSSSWRFALLLVTLLVGGALANFWAMLGEAHVERKALSTFPQHVGSWHQTGGDHVIDSDTMTVLRASDYLLRDYQTDRGEFANFYVGYYGTQRDGATYHSPLNCLPGSGWVLNDPGRITITPSDGSPSFQANRYVIESGSSKSVMVYWYQGRGRRMASEYWGKVYTVLDSVSMRRSDAAMVRITVPVAGSEAAALKLASDLAANTVSLLPGFVPD
jgi:EpsI family protein